MIHVIGLDPTGPDKKYASIMDNADVIFAADRFRGMLKGHKARLEPLVPLEAMISRIQKDYLNREAVILTSGDPLFFGLGRRLLSCFDKATLSFYPSLTTVQRACAKFKIPWDDMEVVSLHGRSKKGLSYLLKAILSKSPYKVGVFTDHVNSPREICTKLLDLGLQGTRVMIAQDIGGIHEKFLDLSLEEVAKHEFHPLNFMILTGEHARPDGQFGLPDHLFQHQKGMITKPEIRSIALSLLELPAGGVMWDIGSGSGSISVESSLLRPGLSIYAVEKQRDRFQDILKNRETFTALNITPILGEAPECLAPLPRPDRIFIGGGLTNKGLLEYCLRCLVPNGIVVGSTVLVESLSTLLSSGCSTPFSCTTLQVSLNRLKPLGPGHMFKPENPITLVRIWKN